jgi:hypothetical protein
VQGAEGCRASILACLHCCYGARPRSVQPALGAALLQLFMWSVRDALLTAPCVLQKLNQSEYVLSG